MPHKLKAFTSPHLNKHQNCTAFHAANRTKTTRCVWDDKKYKVKYVQVQRLAFLHG